MLAITGFWLDITGFWLAITGFRKQSLRLLSVHYGRQLPVTELCTVKCHLMQIDMRPCCMLCFAEASDRPFRTASLESSQQKVGADQV